MVGNNISVTCLRSRRQSSVFEAQHKTYMQQNKQNKTERQESHHVQVKELKRMLLDPSKLLSLWGYLRPSQCEEFCSYCLLLLTGAKGKKSKCLAITCLRQTDRRLWSILPLITLTCICSRHCEHRPSELVLMPNACNHSQLWQD